MMLEVTSFGLITLLTLPTFLAAFAEAGNDVEDTVLVQVNRSFITEGMLDDRVLLTQRSPSGFQHKVKGWCATGSLANLPIKSAFISLASCMSLA